MADESISGLMLRDHARIEASLNKLKNGLAEDFIALMDYFKDFKWEVERHFFFEERVIFSDLNLKDEETSVMVNKILRDHEIILKSLVDINECIEDEEILPDLSKLMVVLKDHKCFEDETVYPRLDSELDEKEKRIIIQRLNF
jgi:hemerythrin-like domain-containing protein